MTSSAINEQVARKLGWIQCCNPGTMENGKIVDCFGWSKGGSHFHEPYLNYSGSIQAAWEIMENKTKDNTWKITLLGRGEQWVCCFEEHPGQMSDPHCDRSLGEADTAPMAICEAFLKLP